MRDKQTKNKEGRASRDYVGNKNRGRENETDRQKNREGKAIRTIQVRGLASKP